MNGSRIRTFIAVQTPVTTRLRKLLSKLNRLNAGAGGTPIREEQLHITLKFLGDVPFEQIPAISNVMSDCAGQVTCCELELHGLGAFPHARRPSVVWLGVRQGEPLIRLAEQLETRLLPLGFAPERRPFHPHVTLLRFRSRPPDVVFQLLEQEIETEFGRVPVDSVTLFQSELLKEGARHTVLATATFGTS